METLVGLKTFRENVDKYVTQVKQGASFIVVRRNEPLFKITSLQEEGWETLIDFTALHKGGVDIQQLLARL